MRGVEDLSIMIKIPFLRPNLVKHDALIPYLKEMEASRIYSNFGPLNTQFENRVLNGFFDNEGAVTTINNATIGLILALSECKRPKGKYVLMPSFTFAATPLAAIWCGLEPYFVDIRSDDWCMDENLLSDLIKKLGDEIAAIVPYATFGTSMNLDYYRQLHDSGIPVVVDAAASFGVTESGIQFGKGFPGCIVYSFHATKTFSVGEGGLIYSSNPEIISKIRQTENFGFSSSRETSLLGLNGKISEYTAAIALSTLDVFEGKINARQQVYKWYLEQLNNRDLLSQGWRVQEAKGKIPYQFMPICCQEWQHNSDVIKLLANQNIEARTYFSPACHQHHLFKNYPHTILPITEKISKQIISLPLWEEMTREDVCQIIEGIVPS